MTEDHERHHIENITYPFEMKIVFADGKDFWIESEFHSEIPGFLPLLTFKDAKGKRYAILLTAPDTEGLRIALEKLQTYPKQPPIPKQS